LRTYFHVLLIYLEEEDESASHAIKKAKKVLHLVINIDFS